MGPKHFLSEIFHISVKLINNTGSSSLGLLPSGQNKQLQTSILLPTPSPGRLPTPCGQRSLELARQLMVLSWTWLGTCEKTWVIGCSIGRFPSRLLTYNNILYFYVYGFFLSVGNVEWAKNKNNPINHFVSSTYFSWGTCCKHQWGNTCYPQLLCPQSSSRGCSICQQKDGGTADGSKWGWNGSDPDLPNIHLQTGNPLCGWILHHEGFQWSWGSCWPAMSIGVWPEDQTWISDQYRLCYVSFFWVWCVNQIIRYRDILG